MEDAQISRRYSYNSSSPDTSMVFAQSLNSNNLDSPSKFEYTPPEILDVRTKSQENQYYEIKRELERGESLKQFQMTINEVSLSQEQSYESELKA